ncbi:DUF2783 domain-containing protein [Shewanella corallii]|uniref:DUF2783 domain-containing protein n=1 Tax=Shewanella corallii TaxID=560080 RepID=A0ABT0N4C5_9GAMM|nr:DUF2783 domain-containing protein [Shewanella corallii]MCL2913287.1 DUF2783 domain-containing protein [Shewanella corallii]
MKLVTQVNFTDGDSFYEALMALHRSLDDSQSLEVNARLILLMANHIGDNQVLKEALEIAGQSVTASHQSQ